MLLSDSVHSAFPRRLRFCKSGQWEDLCGRGAHGHCRWTLGKHSMLHLSVLVWVIFLYYLLLFQYHSCIQYILSGNYNRIGHYRLGVRSRQSKYKIYFEALAVSWRVETNWKMFWPTEKVLFWAFFSSLLVYEHWNFDVSMCWFNIIKNLKKSILLFLSKPGQRGVYSGEALRPARHFVEPNSGHSQQAAQATSGPVRAAGGVWVGKVNLVHSWKMNALTAN